jgi:hypothetical protein
VKKFKSQKVGWAQIERFLQSAEKKLASARRILAIDEEACLQQAYDTLLFLVTQSQESAKIGVGGDQGTIFARGPSEYLLVGCPSDAILARLNRIVADGAQPLSNRRRQSLVHKKFQDPPATGSSRSRTASAA